MTDAHTRNDRSPRPLILIAGPCVIESETLTIEIARSLADMTRHLDVQFVFKASFDKANRTSIHSFRGPGLDAGLTILDRVKTETGVPVLSDIHTAAQVEPSVEVLDVLQIPAFLCRQTDLVTAAAATGKPVNIKKAQFMAPWDMTNVIEKAVQAGAGELWLTERGTAFGYNNLVVDFRSIHILQESRHPVIFDATHSIQLPGGAGTSSGGQRQYAPLMARAAIAAGADGLFLEVHPDPDKALCDGPNSLPLAEVPDLIHQLIRIRTALTAPSSTGQEILP